jgi:hypothetical protein
VNIIIIIISEIELEIEHGMNFRDEMLRENMIIGLANLVLTCVSSFLLEMLLRSDQRSETRE